MYPFTIENWNLVGWWRTWDRTRRIPGHILKKCLNDSIPSPASELAVLESWNMWTDREVDIRHNGHRVGPRSTGLTKRPQLSIVAPWTVHMWQTGSISFTRGQRWKREDNPHSHVLNLVYWSFTDCTVATVRWSMTKHENVIFVAFSSWRGA